MIQFAYSFCMAMLHSLWQAALLLLLYIIANNIIHKNNSPLARRNFLYLAIATQGVLFFCSFFIYFSGTAGTGSLVQLIQTITQPLQLGSIKAAAPWIFVVYIFIITGKMAAAVYNWYCFKISFKRGLQKPAAELKLFTQLKAHQFGIKRKITLWLSHTIQTPLTFGYFKPVILLPVALINNISTQQAETLILHELTHIRTNDYLLNRFLVVAETIFFFNPFVTALCKKIKLEREKNCDVNVLSFQYSPALYAETLLQAEKMKQLKPVFQMAAVNRKKHLLQRIQFFTSQKVINQTLRFNVVAPAVGLMLLLVLCTAVLLQPKNTFELQPAAGLHFIPSDNYIAPNGYFGNTAFKTNPVKLRVEEKLLNKQVVTGQKFISKTISTAHPKPEEPLIASTEANFYNNNPLAKPATVNENDAARQIIIKEEGSGTASVKVYNLIFADGKWMLQPDWVLTAKEIAADSLNSKFDSLPRSLRKVYPAQQ